MNPNRAVSTLHVFISGLLHRTKPAIASLQEFKNAAYKALATLRQAENQNFAEKHLGQHPSYPCRLCFHPTTRLRFHFRTDTDHADHTDCIDLRHVVQPARFVSNLPNCVTTMHSNDSGYDIPPFPAFPSTDRYIPLGSVKDAVERLGRSIQAKDAISVVIGPPGTGKTLICGLLSAQNQRSHQVITLGETPFADSDSFLRRILHQLGSESTNIPNGDLSFALFDRLCLDHENESGLLLLVDEAQSLTPELFETVRTLTNLTRNGQPCVSVVLSGGTQLDELLIAPAMDAFRQRVSTRCYLHPLNGEETAWYINQTIRNCGSDPNATITADAISAVHHACSGVPRLLNQLLTHAIEYASLRDEYLITDGIIEMAWAEVQQLPSPMIDEPEIEINSSNIEFGELDELPDPVTDKMEYEPTLTESSDMTDDAPCIDSISSERESTFESETVEQSTHESTSTDDYDVFEFDFEPNHESTLPLATEHSSTAEQVSPPEDDTNSDTELVFPQLATPALAENAELQPGNELDSELDEDFNAELDEDFNAELDATLNAELDATLNAELDATSNVELDGNVNPAKSASDFLEVSANTKSNEDLFGAFEDEQNLTTMNKSILSPMIYPINTDQIESILHEEILDINGLLLDTNAASVQYRTEDTVPGVARLQAQADLSDNRLDQPHDIEIGCQDSSQQQQISTESLDAPALTTSLDSTETELDALNSGTDKHSDAVSAPYHGQDDSDLLVIEDEVELRRIDKAKTSTDSPQPILVDYRQLLARMRSEG